MDDATFQQLRESLLAGTSPEQTVEDFDLPSLKPGQQETLALDFEIGGLLASDGAEFELSSPADAARLSSPARRLPSLPLPLGLAIAGAAACLAVWAALQFPTEPQLPEPTISTSAVEFRPFADGSPDFPTQLATEIYQRARQVATITFKDAASDILGPQELTPGVLNLHEGTVELSFLDVARVHVRAPAKLEILGPRSAYLHRGSLAVEDSGKGGHFTVYHARGKIIDIGTAFDVRVGEGDEVDLYVQEGTVDVYDGSGLSLQRLQEGQQIVTSADTTTLHRPESPPAWVSSRPVSKNSGKTEETIAIRSVTWLQGELGTGKAAGSLGGGAVRIEGAAAANGGALYTIDWCQYLTELSPAASWYHPESVAIAAHGKRGDGPVAAPVTVRFEADITDPILLFGWGEAGLQVDLRGLDSADDDVFVSHPSITFDEGILDFGEVPKRQNIPGQATAIRLSGTFGPDRPLRFQLLNSLPRGESVAFSVALPSEG